MTNFTNSLGAFGETKTCELYIARGFEILTRNYRNRGFELDIVAHKANQLHVIEVKTRTGSNHYQLHDLLSKAKLSSLKKGVQHFISRQNQLYWYSIQLDLVVVDINKNSQTSHVEVWENIFDLNTVL